MIKFRYEDDSFTGVYRYFRSLAIRQPFITARDNLKAQFEKNRLKLEMEENSQHDENNLELFLLRYISFLFSPPLLPFERFVRLQGIFFNKTELDSIMALKATLLRSFSSLLASNTGPNVVVETVVLLKLVAMLIFTVSLKKKRGWGGGSTEYKVQEQQLANHHGTWVPEGERVS